MGQPFCKNFLIDVKAPRDSRKKSDWFHCKKISMNLKYFNFECEQSERYFSSDSIGFTDLHTFNATISLATVERCEWKSGFADNEKQISASTRKDAYIIKNKISIPYFLECLFFSNERPPFPQGYIEGELRLTERKRSHLF